MSRIPAPTIEVIVNTDGSTVVQTHGFAGASCRDASQFLERALGQKTSEQRTPEFFASQSEPQRERERS